MKMIFSWLCQAIFLTLQEIQSESDSMSVRASPSGYAVPYHSSISITGGFAFGNSAETCFHVVYIQHVPLKG